MQLPTGKNRPKLPPNVSIADSMEDSATLELLAELARLEAELAAVLPWAQTMYNMIPSMTTIDEELAYTLTEMQEAAPETVRQPRQGTQGGEGAYGAAV